MEKSPIVNKPRIEYIDLAKGFCIILVVLRHLSNYYTYELPYPVFFKAFRMPLYFFLSGCFFKAYEGFGGFTKRKINKLLIPFLFFYILTSIIVPYIQVFHLKLKTSYLHRDEIFTAILNESYPNQPIWFLVCLFEIGIIFYFIYSIAQRFKNYTNWIICLGSLSIGIIGLTLGIYRIELPATIDTAFSAMPFYVAGYMCFRKTDILKPNKYDKYLPILIVLAFAFVFIFCHRKIHFLHNTFTIHSALVVYPCGLLGTYGIIMLAKLLKKLPLISYFGRYSIIILVTHIEVLNIFAAVLKYSGLNLSVGYTYLLNFILMMLSYLLIIPFMRKFMPHVTAQKDLIQINN
ncbi:MAG: acyltransferase [Bacteroidales bacterium]|nr:acyltransferase [Bacteroidales bacterium]